MYFYRELINFDSHAFTDELSNYVITISYSSIVICLKFESLQTPYREFVRIKVVIRFGIYRIEIIRYEHILLSMNGLFSYL